MKTKISIILLLISLVLLIVYGLDVISANRIKENVANDTSIKENAVSTSGFLKLKESVRGGVLGGGGVVLSVLAFSISLREKSSIVVILLLINGALIVGGMTALYIQSLQQTTTKGHFATVFGTMALGFLLVALGIVKFRVASNRKIENRS
jgi:flagellar basal body-associated protein FliL